MGDNLEWKNAQKKETKKNTSEVINSTMPHFSPAVTIRVCSPWNDPSRETSRHQVNETKIREIKLINIRVLLLLWNQWANPVVSPRPIKEVRMGHGDSSTRWNGWFIEVDI